MWKAKRPFENARVEVQGQKKKKKRENEIIGILWDFPGGNRILRCPNIVEIYKSV